MGSIADILEPDRVVLRVGATDKASAVREVMEALRGTPEVVDFDAFQHAVVERDAPAIAEDGCGICIAHGRCGGVRSLVMSAGRTDGIITPEIVPPLRLVFVIGIPRAIDSEYLRVVGAIVRVCKDPALLRRLLAAKDGQTFVRLLSSAEVQL